MSNKLHRTYLPSYDEAVQMCSSGKKKNAVFYENKYVVDNYNVSVFNYRLAQFTDFSNPIKGRSEINCYEMRGLTFVFNTDGTVFKRYLLLEKFFNLNQVTESMYNRVKDFEIKNINNKEDGSVASFIKLPNGKVVGKSKMSFESDQAYGINRIYKTNKDVKEFVDYTLDNDITAVFEYVAPHNRIVLRYTDEELILLKLRDNKTGKHLDISDYSDKLGNIKVANFEKKRTLDELIELMKVEEDKEGYVVHTIDNNGHDFFYKMKTEWYIQRHGLLTNDLYREHVIVGYILDDNIDDVVAQIPEDEVEVRERVDKLIDIVRTEVYSTSEKIDNLYKEYLNMKSEVSEHYLNKFFAQKYKKNPYFGSVMLKANRGSDSFKLATEMIRKSCLKLESCRKWLKKKDPTLFFTDTKEEM